MKEGRPAAVIDIGSNTTRLLVAERRGGGLRKLLSHRAYNRLARGRDADGAVPAVKIDQLVQTLALQQQLARVLGVDQPTLVATAATRSAANRDELLAAVRERCGLEITVLDEEEEARLAFFGATHALAAESAGTVAVADVGGGSTEVAVGRPQAGVEWSRSFASGSSSVAEHAFAHDPPTHAELDVARTEIAEAFAGTDFPAVDEVVAVGGTASSLRRLIGNVLEHETLERAIRLITSHPAAEVAERFEIDLERVQVLPAGMIILEQVGDRLQRPLKIGRGGLREGKLLELLL